jgi:hypothetical protein
MPHIFLALKKTQHHQFLHRLASVFVTILSIFTSGLASAQINLGILPGIAFNIVNTGSLSFGSFVANSGGVITIASDGGRSRNGTITLIAQGASSSAAQFTVTGTLSSQVSITLPADGVISLSNGQGATMAVTTFQSNSTNSGQIIIIGGSQTLRVGAKLVVGNAQAPGSYSGTFPVTVNYP